MIAAADCELVWDTRCFVGESPTWEPKSRRLFFTDAEKHQILAYGVDDGSKQIWTLPDQPRSFGFCRSGRLVVALTRRMVLFDLASNAVTDLTGDLSEPQSVLLNDGRVGPDGWYWVGGSNQDRSRERISSLYRVSPAGKVERVIASAFATLNGLAWSPDERTMYFADSAPGTIERCDFNPQTGAMSGRKIIATMTNPDGRPDGANCDMAGNYWSAGVSAGRLNCFDRDGKLIQAIALPIPAPSMPCFADRWLFITTLRKNRPEEMVRQYPALGGLYRMTAPTTGPTLPLFQDS